jgi:hypothetical protein
MTSSGMVEGGGTRKRGGGGGAPHGRAVCNNPPYNCVKIAQHLGCRNANHAEALTLQKRIAGFVAPRLIAAIMALPVHFDDQAPLKAGEIRRQLPNRELPSKLVPVRSLAKHLP